MLASTAAHSLGDAVTRVPYRRDTSGLVIVDVTLQDGQTYPFMLDTGYYTSVIDAGLAKRLGLRSRGSVRMSDFQTTGRLPVVRLERLALGDVELGGVGAVTLDGPWDGAACTEPFAGILGSNALAQGVVEIDDARGEVHFATGGARLPARSGGTTYAFAAGHRYPAIQVPLQGAPVTFLFDTGNPTTIDVTPSLAAGISASPSIACTSRTSAHGTFGPQTDTPQPCRAFVWPEVSGAGELEGIVAKEAGTNMLGAGLLPYFTARVDYGAGAVTLWRNDRPIDASWRSFGVDLACDESGGLFAGTLWTGSQAARAGIREGDRIEGVVADGKTVASPCGCDSPCGCGAPRRVIESAEVLELRVAGRAGSIRLEKTDLLGAARSGTHAQARDVAWARAAVQAGAPHLRSG